MDRKEVVFLSGARTPMTEWIGGKRGDGKAGGALASISAIDLGAIVAKAAVERARLQPADIEPRLQELNERVRDLEQSLTRVNGSLESAAFELQPFVLRAMFGARNAENNNIEVGWLKWFVALLPQLGAVLAPLAGAHIRRRSRAPPW